MAFRDQRFPRLFICRVGRRTKRRTAITHAIAEGLVPLVTSNSASLLHDQPIQYPLCDLSAPSRLGRDHRDRRPDTGDLSTPAPHSRASRRFPKIPLANAIHFG